jgi:hypothetical protein
MLEESPGMSPADDGSQTAVTGRTYLITLHRLNRVATATSGSLSSLKTGEVAFHEPVRDVLQPPRLPRPPSLTSLTDISPGGSSTSTMPQVRPTGFAGPFSRRGVAGTSRESERRESAFLRESHVQRCSRVLGAPAF